MSKTHKEKIAKLLIAKYDLTKADVDQAIVYQRDKGIGLEKALVGKGFIQEEDLVSVLVKELEVPFINLERFRVDPFLQEIIPERFARQYEIIPISLLDYTLTIAVSDPFNFVLRDDLKSITGRDIEISLSVPSQIFKAIDGYYGIKTGVSVQEISQDIQEGALEIVSEAQEDEDIDVSVDESGTAPIIRMVNLVIKEALKQRASDIHIEPMEDCVRVRYRIDGILQTVLDIPKENQKAVIVRIKIMSQLDITANQVPQDGRFKLRLGNKEVDFRISILPTTFGQKVVMRVLDKANLSVGLAGLGISKKALEVLDDSIHKPFGMVMVTGPTGSGKSTTLYSIINELNSVDKNIITVEDPVEYLVEGLTQIQARPEIGLTFAEGLRAMLRQSPDIVMVGEIRDNETADIAIKASLTGQLVFSTLHTNDAAGALTRLIDMGVEPFLVASSLVMISAQRLCRKICPQCKEEIEIPKDVLEPLNYDFKPGTVFYAGKGCPLCRDTGYLGRMCVTEVLAIDDEIRNMLLKGKSSDDIKEYAQKEKGMATLWEDAMSKCLAGLTTLEDVIRITTCE
ncbi:Type IV fimbrial assembly, ATPase PilB [hydrothermal vent metagenome]|uniref:Type IV fimbrial assembly, ATPase PilB n=1 Tax=hydrothermal vent metagenome TaxID=652676 RepID=A0A3B1DYZ6_9ZZZZ